MVHSNCYRIPRSEGGPSGENLGLGYRSPTHVVDAWYNEIKKCKSFPGCLGKFTRSTGHFTAMIWAGAKTLACTIGTKSPKVFACRFGIDGGKSAMDLPNMGGYFKK